MSTTTKGKGLKDVKMLEITKYGGCGPDRKQNPEIYENVPFTIDSTVLKGNDEFVERLRLAKKNPEDNRLLVIDAGTLFYNGCESLLSKSAAEFKNENYSLLFRANNEMIAARGKYSKEKYFYNLFVDIKNNFQDWEVFFSLDNKQYDHAEFATGILGNLATIYRQRGVYQDCLEVMIIYRFAMDAYVALTEARKKARIATIGELTCCRELVMKHHKVKANLWVNLDRADGVAETYRFLIGYEMEKGVVGTDQEEYAWMLEHFCGKRPLNKATLDATTDAELDNAAERMRLQMKLQMKRDPKLLTSVYSDQEYLAQFGVPLNSGPILDLLPCAYCDVLELAPKSYKKCSACRSVQYCSPQCQKSHWKSHKQDCKNSPSQKENVAVVADKAKEEPKNPKKKKKGGK